MRTRLATLLQNANLLRHLAQPADDFLITVVKGEDSVRNAGVLAEFENQILCATQVMARDARVEMVDGLELQAAVKEVEPGRAVHVHGGAEHLLREGFVDAQVCGGHGEVGERNLHVERRGDHVRDQNESEAALPVWDRAVYHAVSEPGPEEDLTTDLQPAVPPGGTFLGRLAAEEILKAQAVEVESAEEEDRVVEVVLEFQEKLGGGVKGQDPVVVGAAETGQEAVGDGEERHVFDVGVMLRGVGNDVVHVVVSLPPA